MRSLLKIRLKWQVGNGESIHVLDSWLPDKCVVGLNIRALQSRQIQKVSQLLSPDRSQWCTTTLEQVLVPAEVHLVKSIPLSGGGSPDRLFWKLERHGNFSVHSAYQLAGHLQRSKH